MSKTGLASGMNTRTNKDSNTTDIIEPDGQPTQYTVI